VVTWKKGGFDDATYVKAQALNLITLNFVKDIRFQLII